MLYEPRQYENILLIDSADKVYVEVSLYIKRYTGETLKDYPITATTNSSGGKDINIPIATKGVSEGEMDFEHKSFTYEIMDSNATDEAGVKTDIGTKLYNITTTVYQAGTPKKRVTGTITQNSDIEII